jgi:hypothetical protein
MEFERKGRDICHWRSVDIMIGLSRLWPGNSDGGPVQISEALIDPFFRWPSTLRSRMHFSLITREDTHSLVV